MGNEGWMSDVFVSYARLDEPRAKRIAESLRQQGHDVWRDEDLPAHQPYADVIEEQLSSAKAVVVLWSKEAVKSQWVRAEADTARSLGTLIQASLDGTVPKIPFNQIQCADLSEWDGSEDCLGWQKLRASVEALAGNPQSYARSRGGQRGRSVCVLPFVNMSGDPEQEYFSDGISEDITTDLSKVSALAVTARNTAFQFKGKSVDVCDVARRLAVSHVLEGSVRKAGNRVRITAQLIDGSSGGHVWAERYDRDLNDIFAIQDEISRSIVDALKVKLLPGEKQAIADRGTASAEAYDLFLMARQYWISGNDGDPRRYQIIFRLCRSALEIDPGYARAWSLIALAQSDWHRRDVSIEETGIAAAEKALELDPTLAEPHSVKADYLAKSGRFSEADAETEVALNLDPESWEVNKEAALVSYRQGRLEEAMQRFGKAASLMENDWRSAGMMMSCAHGLGDEEGARAAAKMVVERAERVIAVDRSNASAMAHGAGGLAALGEIDRAKEWMRRAMLLDPDNAIMRYNLACVATKELDDPDAALELIAPFVNQANPYQIKHIENDPDMAKLHRDKRFQEMLAAARKRLGIETAAASQAAAAATEVRS